MSGFTRDTKYYGDRLVYEALMSKWSRYHARCRCGNNWITHHAEPAGFTVVREGSGFVALVGPGLTEGVDESTLTTNALWEAVTGEAGTQDWYETVKVIDRHDAEAKIVNGQAPVARRARAATGKTVPITEPQLRYLTSLITRASKERFDAEFAAAITGTTIAAREPQEKTMQAVKRLTKAAAGRLITGLRT